MAKMAGEPIFVGMNVLRAEEQAPVRRLCCVCLDCRAARAACNDGVFGWGSESA